MKDLSSRERVVAALNHIEPDMVPIDFGSMRSSGINAIAYNKLKAYLNFNKYDTKLYDVKQLLADPDEDILKYFQGDVVQLKRLSPSIGLKIDKWKPGKLMDGSDCLVPENFNPIKLGDGSDAVTNVQGIVTAKRPDGGYYFDEVYNPLHDAESEDDIDKLAFPSITDEELAYLAENAKNLYENTDYAILGAAGVSIFEKGFKDFGYEEYLVRAYTDKELIEYYLNKLTDAYISMLDKYIDAVGSYIQVIECADDLGMQSSTILPPDVYRELFKPFHTKIFQFIKSKNKNLKICLHSCGSIYPLIPDLIEAGVDALNPVQINAKDMDPARLKREFGKDVTFWGGGCSTQTTLTFGSVDDVISEVKELTGIFAPGGGFVFNQVHNIQADIAPEKVVALYNTIKEIRKYPII